MSAHYSQAFMGTAENVGTANQIGEHLIFYIGHMIGNSDQEHMKENCPMLSYCTQNVCQFLVLRSFCSNKNKKRFTT